MNDQSAGKRLLCRLLLIPHVQYHVTTNPNDYRGRVGYQCSLGAPP